MPARNGTTTHGALVLPSALRASSSWPLTTATSTPKASPAKSSRAALRRGGIEVGEGLEDLVVVGLGRRLGDHGSDDAVRADDERRPAGAQVRAPVHRLLAPDPVGLADGVVLVGQQGEVQPLRVVERLTSLTGSGETPITTAPADS